MSDSAILSDNRHQAKLFKFVTSLSFDIIDNWNIGNQFSTSCVRPCHVILFLVIFSVLVSTMNSYSWYQDSTLCLLFQ
jgi:hypothetical protein